MAWQQVFPKSVTVLGNTICLSKFCLTPRVPPRRTHMKLPVNSLLLVLLGTVCVQAQISSFQHVVIIVQENRTPDNLFQGLCHAPFGSAALCSTTPTANQYDILTSNWLDKTSPSGVTQPTTVPLGN